MLITNYQKVQHLQSESTCQFNLYVSSLPSFLSYFQRYGSSIILEAAYLSTIDLIGLTSYSYLKLSRVAIFTVLF